MKLCFLVLLNVTTAAARMDGPAIEPDVNTAELELQEQEPSPGDINTAPSPTPDESLESESFDKTLYKNGVEEQQEQAEEDETTLDEKERQLEEAADEELLDFSTRPEN